MLHSIVERNVMNGHLPDETRYRLLTYLSGHPEASQRDIADALGVSVGKVNYCVKALVGKGLIKVRNFKNSRNKAAYAYYLTPKGLEEKVKVTYAFLRRKVVEYDLLKEEIERLTLELGATSEAVR